MNEFEKLINYLANIFDTRMVEVADRPLPILSFTVALIAVALAAWLFRFTFRFSHPQVRDTHFGIEINRGLVGFVLLFVLWTGSYILFGVLAGTNASVVDANSTFEEVSRHHLFDALGAIFRSAFCIYALFWFRNTYARENNTIGFSWPQTRNGAILLNTLGWWALMIALGFAGQTSAELFDPAFMPIEQQVATGYRLESDWNVVAAILGAAVAAPIVEEVGFRYLLYGGLRDRLPFWPAALISAGIFTAVHAPWDTPQVFFPIMGLGIALAWIYESTRNIWYCVAFHAMHNFVMLLVMGII